MLEIDVTSYTEVEDYLPYQVPDVWLVRDQQLLIYKLQDNNYSAESQSQYFPEVNVADMVAQCLNIAYQRNTSAAIRHLKQWLGN